MTKRDPNTEPNRAKPTPPPAPPPKGRRGVKSQSQAHDGVKSQRKVLPATGNDAGDGDRGGSLVGGSETGCRLSEGVMLAGGIQHWPIARLVPYDRNPRTHSDDQIAQLAAAMTEFGFTQPILVDEQSGILAGHGRLMAAKRLGLTIVPVIELTHLSEPQKKAYVIADNKLALESGWDAQVLAANLRDLQDDGYDLELTGFDDEDLARIQDDIAEINLKEIATATAAPKPASKDPSEPSGDSGKSDAGGEKPGDFVPLNAIMTLEHRNEVLEAAKLAKEKHGLDTLGEALFAICNEWRLAQQ